MTNNVPRSANHPAGYDEDDPYENEDIQKFPTWWKESIELFREHKLRPYRPPQFNDEVLTPEVLDELEHELDISIQLKAVNPKFGDDWGVWIDGEKITEISRQRTEEGRTVYGISSESFKKKIQQAVSGEKKRE